DEEVVHDTVGIRIRLRFRLVDRVAAVDTIAIQRTIDDSGLRQRRCPQAEIPVVVVAIAAKSSQRAEECALHEQVAAGYHDVELDQRKAVRLRTHEIALLLQNVRDRRAAPRAPDRYVPDTRHQREAPRDT